jgi:hypothetical protein
MVHADDSKKASSVGTWGFHIAGYKRFVRFRPLAWGRTQSQFTKRCIFQYLDFKAIDKVQKPSNSWVGRVLCFKTEVPRHLFVPQDEFLTTD